MDTLSTKLSLQKDNLAGFHIYRSCPLPAALIQFMITVIVCPKSSDAKTGIDAKP